ncbi:MAG: VWA domain-containing protein [Porticoccaceae bacterium]|nr:VWA domain-containing protein [Porticoccaceae bacterium]
MTELIANLHQFHFLRPWWLCGFIAVIACAWMLQRRGRNPGSWSKIIAPELLPLLVQQGSGASVNLRPWVLLAGTLAVIALAGPAWNKKAMSVHKQEQALVILFDLSPSMLATDIKPNRLIRARLKTIDLLNAYREGTVALIAFAGDAHVVTPLTDDTNTIITQLPVLHPNIMPSVGSNAEAALAKALELAMNAGHLDGDILLVSDGLTPDARENLQATLRQFPDFRLSILGVGSDEGAPIPLNEYGFARDSGGGIVVAQLHSKELEGLARRAGGVYRSITGSDADIDALLTPIQERGGQQARELERNLDIWQDQGFWLVLLLLPFAALLFRKGLLAALVLLPLAYTPDGYADFWNDLWLTPDQQGAKALAESDPESAEQLFKDPMWRGIAASRAGNNDEAAEILSQLQSADAHYNRGNALARAGKLDEAIAAYREALTLNPEMDDAAHNKALVESMKNQRENQQNQGQNQDSGNSEGESGQQQDQQQDSAQQNSSGKPQDDSQQNQGEGKNTDTKAQQDNQGAEKQGTENPNGGKQADNRQTGDQPPPEQSSNPSGQTPEPQAPQQDNNAASPSDGNPIQRSPPEEDKNDGDTAKNGNAAATESGMTETERQNAEQWLRRVPDDPGGLLRNKFDYEARQRFREEGGNPRLPPGNYTEERW